MAQWNFGEAIAQILANQKEQSFREMQRQDAIKAREEDREFRDLSMQFDKERANEANRQFQQTFAQNAEEAKLRKLQADRAYRADTYDQSELEALISANPKLRGVLGGIKFDEQGNADTRAVDAIINLTTSREKEARDADLAVKLANIQAGQNSEMRALQRMSLEQTMRDRELQNRVKLQQFKSNSIIPEIMKDKSYAFMAKNYYKSTPSPDDIKWEKKMSNIGQPYLVSNEGSVWQKQKESNTKGLLNFTTKVAQPLMDLYLENQAYGVSDPTLESEIINVGKKLKDAYDTFDQENSTLLKSPKVKIRTGYETDGTGKPIHDKAGNLIPKFGDFSAKAAVYNEYMRFKPLLEQIKRMEEAGLNAMMANEAAKYQGRMVGKNSVTGESGNH